QSAPRRRETIARERARQTETAVMAQPVVIPARLNGVRIWGGPAFSSGEGPPTLIAHGRNAEQLEQLERDVRLHDRIRPPLVEHLTPQIGKPLFLEGRGRR